MTMEEIRRKVASEEYDFLRKEERLGDRMILLGLGGSHAYGTENEQSDLDLRGCALNSRKEHDLLMDIRSGAYLDESGKPTADFFEMVNEFEKRLEYAREHTSLPDEPDYKEIDEFVMSVNERVVRGTI